MIIHFSDLNKIRPYLPEAIKNVVADSLKLDAYLSAADELIRIESGLAISDYDTPGDVPNWVHYPAACIVAQVALSQIDKSDNELIDRVLDDYNSALKILRRHRYRLTYANFGEIEPGV